MNWDDWQDETVRACLCALRDPLAFAVGLLPERELEQPADEYGRRFSASELRAVFERIHGLEIDPSNFRKRVLRWLAEGRLEERGMLPTATRPATAYILVDEDIPF